jgi:hypothetical protein
MKTVFLGLKFDFPSLCANGSAYVIPVRHTTDELDTILLTPESASLAELEGYISSMRSDLDTILVEARRKFAEARAAGPQEPFLNK